MDDFERFKQGIEETTFRVWCFMMVWPIICVVVGFIEYHYFPKHGSTKHALTPLLSGPAQITLLALIIALAAYLRSIRNSALELRDKIRQGKVPSYPPHDSKFTYVSDTMAHLEKIANAMSVAGPYFIWLTMIIVARLVYETYLRWLGSDLQDAGKLFIADTVIALWFSAGIIALMILHFKGRIRDERLRLRARFEESEALLCSEQAKKASLINQGQSQCSQAGIQQEGEDEL